MAAAWRNISVMAAAAKINSASKSSESVSTG
jgi:hypothetical protein